MHTKKSRSTLPQSHYVNKFLSGTFSPSKMTIDDVARYGRKFGLPEGYSVRCARENEFPNTSPNPNEICLYMDQIRLGLTFQKLKIFEEILNHLQLSFSILAPNFVHIVIILYTFCRLHNLEWNKNFFLYLFSLKPITNYVTFRPRSTKFTTFGLNSSIHHWKVNYFFVKSPKGWSFPVTPSTAPDEVLCLPNCPTSLDDWFTRNPQPCYIIYAKTCDLMTQKDVQVVMDKDKEKGKEVAPTSARKRKFKKLSKDQSKKAKQTEKLDSDQSDTSSNEDTDESDSRAESNHDQDEDDEDKTGEDDDLDIGGGEEPVDTEVQDEDVFPPYFVNSSGNLELSNISDLPLVDNPYNRFGSTLSDFLTSKTETQNFKRLRRRDLMSVFHNNLISTMRMGAYLNASDVNNQDAAVKYKCAFEALEINHGVVMHRVSELEKIEDGHKEALVKVAKLEEEIATYSTVSIENQNLLTELNDLRVMFDTKEELCSKKDAEIDMLKKSIAEKDQKIAELSKSVSVDGASTSQNLTDEEKFAQLKDSIPYSLDMVEFLSQGFEKFRRAALRRFTDPAVTDIIKEIDIYVADKEEDISDDDSDSV